MSISNEIFLLDIYLIHNVDLQNTVKLDEQKFYFDLVKNNLKTQDN